MNFNNDKDFDEKNLAKFDNFKNKSNLDEKEKDNNKQKQFTKEKENIQFSLNEENSPEKINSENIFLNLNSNNNIQNANLKQIPKNDFANYSYSINRENNFDLQGLLLGNIFNKLKEYHIVKIFNNFFKINKILYLFIYVDYK